MMHFLNKGLDVTLHAHSTAKNTTSTIMDDHNGNGSSSLDKFLEGDEITGNSVHRVVYSDLVSKPRFNASFADSETDAESFSSLDYCEALIGESESCDGCSRITSTSTSSSSSKQVHFSCVEVREYNITLGDHPCADAYPVSLSWEHTHELTVDIDNYESQRAEVRQRGRRLNTLSTIQRRIRLYQVAGFQPKDLVSLERERVKQSEKELRELFNKVDPDEELLLYAAEDDDMFTEHEEDDYSEDDSERSLDAVNDIFGSW